MWRTPIHTVVPRAGRFSSTSAAGWYFLDVTQNPFVCHPPFCIWSVEANNRIAMFGANFTKAAAGNNTLELVNGTFFLGEESLGYKLFIRPCYRKLSERILNDFYKRSHLVVTGTPGIGKSVFGLYLMYLLRCEGKTVVFERKSDWYRFNDEGVIKGDVASFRQAGFLDDESSWYLSDPDAKPQELLSLRTVVLVSPNYERTKEFMKLSGLAQQIFMPVWKVDELLDCQCAVFPDVPSDVVKQRFAEVGGVARAVFDEIMFNRVKKGILDALQTRSVRTLINAAFTWHGQFRTDETGDKLFHIWSSDVDDFTECTIELASKYMGDAVVSTIDKRGSEELEDLLAAAFDYPDVARMIGGSVRGKLFERLAHRRIGEARIAKEPFKMAILNSSGVVSGDSLNFSFSASKEFKGNDFPSDFESGIYYTPVSQNFPAIDSFGVGGSDNDTLFLFQMESTGAESGDGRVVGEHWNVAKKSASLKHLVFVFVVPEETQWEESMRLTLGGSKSKSKNWLTGAPPDVKSCGVCIVGIPVKR